MKVKRTTIFIRGLVPMDWDVGIGRYLGAAEEKFPELWVLGPGDQVNDDVFEVELTEYVRADANEPATRLRGIATVFEEYEDFRTLIFTAFPFDQEDRREITISGPPFKVEGGKVLYNGNDRWSSVEIHSVKKLEKP